jgi:cytochrome c-type biogenesis protein CcmH
MSAWTIIAIASCLCLMPLMWALSLRGQSGSLSAAEADNDHYHAQIGEIERLRAAGTLSPKDAEAARIEAARRRLAAPNETAATTLDPQTAQRLRIGLSILFLVVVPSVAGLIYHRFGQPTLQDMSLATRKTEEPEVFRAIDVLNDLEARIGVNPDDGAAHDALGPIYMQLGRFGEAQRAYKAASRVLGDTPVRLAGQAEALVSSSNGRVEPEARLLFARVLELDPANGAARFYGGLALSQDGRKQEAAAIFQSLWNDTPDTELRKLIETQLSEIGSSPPGTKKQP